MIFQRQELSFGGQSDHREPSASRALFTESQQQSCRPGWRVVVGAGRLKKKKSKWTEVKGKRTEMKEQIKDIF